MRRCVALLLIAACGGTHQGDDDGDDVVRVDARVVDGDVVTVDARVVDGATTATTVGSSGGTVTSPDGVIVTIPAGALATDTEITITVVTDQVPNGIFSKLYALGPDGTQFAEPVELTLPYDPSLVGANPETDLAVATRTGPGTFTGTGWVLIDAARDTATAYITHFSEWAIVPAPPGSCQIDYGCWQSCSGAQIPDLCCSLNRGTCRAWLSTSFPSFVDCYGSCIGTPQVANFGNSTCMSSCCTDQGWTVRSQGACYRADATIGEAQTVLDCARGCFDGADQNTLCGTGDIQFDACAWNATMSPNLGDECVGQPGGGVNGQQLYTDLGGIYDQVWGNPPVIHVTGGAFNASSIGIPLSCATAVSATGTMTGTWNGFMFSGPFTFGTGQDGTFQIWPAWPQN